MIVVVQAAEALARHPVGAGSCRRVLPACGQGARLLAANPNRCGLGRLLLLALQHSTGVAIWEGQAHTCQEAGPRGWQPGLIVGWDAADKTRMCSPSHPSEHNAQGSGNKLRKANRACTSSSNATPGRLRPRRLHASTGRPSTTAPADQTFESVMQMRCRCCKQCQTADPTGAAHTNAGLRSKREWLQNAPPSTALEKPHACWLWLEVCAHCRWSIVLDQGRHQVYFCLQCIAGVQTPRHACVTSSDQGCTLAPDVECTWEHDGRGRRAAAAEGSLGRRASGCYLHRSAAVSGAPVHQRLSMAARVDACGNSNALGEHGGWAPRQTSFAIGSAVCTKARMPAGRLPCGA